ncbi:cytochrome P450 [Streptomyces marincola]|uniref:cytochrome P450 n=1 Tax=Streptomyces marincola TaxID=2878388 RepID=UPI001CF4880C|nr:cytochrome P450 [Streptomyces marincola]UCM87938.1 cytochrome P450 [Streptomyces marincola]
MTTETTATTATPEQADQALMALLTPPFPENPFPLYETLRSVNRVHPSAQLGLWALSGYDEVTEFLRLPDVKSGARAAALRRPDWADHLSLRMYLNTMVTLNQPDHGRIRGMASRVFTPKAIKKMQPVVERLTDGLIDGLVERSAGGEPVDLVDLLAMPFPVAVISEMLGLPFEDGKRLWLLADDWSRVFSGIYLDEDLVRADAAAEELTGYFGELIARRRTDPRDDLLSNMVQAADGGRLDEDELIALILFLFTAGFAATTNLIATGVLALMDHQDELARWREDKSITDSAVEELLRHTTHTTAASRVTPRPITIAGTEIPEGVLVLTLLAAANRDPARFPDPHRLDLTRDNGPHLSFSAGAHYCFGGSLARMEGADLFPKLIDTFPKIELAGAPERRDIMGLTGYATLPLALTR